MIKEHKNFLTKEEFKKIYDLLTGDNFPWYLNNNKTFIDKNYNIHDWQLTHTFYKNFNIWSSFFNFLEPLIKKINPVSLLRIKVNLTAPHDKIISYGMHTDFDYKEKNIKTGIFYINTNNGLTIFENNIKYKSEKNKFIFFPCNLKHAGTTHTDTKQRIVLNINWI